MKSLELIPTQEVLLDTFTRDSVGRSDLVLRLAEMINEIDGHYAIAIDSKWGSGKTFFVKQVKLVLDSFNSFGVQTLSEEEKLAIAGYIQSDKRRRAKPIEFEPQVCVYYDAWENDNDDDPIMSLIYCILGSVQEDYSFKEEKDLFKLSASIIDCFAKLSTKDVVESLRSEDPLEKIKKSKNLQNMINSFMTDILKERGNRLVLFIDELDRCKPTFAVRLLERIKHYFSNDNITFVFSVNGDALQHTIRQYYGYDFDASRYIDRFFDITMALPPVNTDKFCEYIGIRNTFSVFDEFRKTIVKKYHLEMREIIRYFSITEAAAYNVTHRKNSYGFSDEQAYLISVVCVFPVAIALRITDMEAYNNFISGKDGTPLVEMIDREKCSGLCRLLLAPGETYDAPRDSREVKVSVADKIGAVYSALFEKQFGRSEYEITIGDACFSAETRESFFKLLSLLSEDANYSFQ